MNLVVWMTLLVSAQDEPKSGFEILWNVRHPSMVNTVAVSPDSKTLVAGLDDGVVLVYSLEKRRFTPVALRSFGSITGVAFHPDGATLAFSDGWNLSFVDTSNFKMTKHFRVESWIDKLAYLPDGSALFIAQNNRHLLKLKMPDATIEKDIIPDKDSPVVGLACSPDGKVVATANEKGQIMMWSADDLGAIRNWKAHEKAAPALAFDGSGKFLASGSEDLSVKVWSVADGSPIKTGTIHHEVVSCLSFTPDGRLISGGQDGLCQFWKSDTFDPDKSYPGYRGFITSSAVSPDGRWLVRGGSMLDLVPLDRPDAPTRLREFGGAIVAMDADPAGKKFATASLDREAIVWSWDKIMSAQAVPLEDWGTAVSLSPDLKTLAVGLGNGKIELYSTETLNKSASWAAHRSDIVSIVFGDSIVSGGSDGNVGLWTCAGESVATLSAGSAIRCMVADPRGRRVAVGTMNGSVLMLDLEKKAFLRTMRSRPYTVQSMSWSPDGTLLAVGYFDGTVALQDVESEEGRREAIGKGESALSLQFNSKGDRLAAGFADGIIRLFDPATLTVIAEERTSLAREIFGLRFVRDDATFVTAGADHALTLRRFKGKTEKVEPMTEDEGRKLFEESYKLHEEKKYEQAIVGFIKVARALPDSVHGFLGAYNAACGFALLGKKAEAIEWFRRSIEHGYDDLEHMQKDSDLESVRDEEGFKAAIDGLKGEELSEKDARERFNACYTLLEEKKYRQAIEGFRQVFWAVPDTELGQNAAYNVACGYAMQKKTFQALEWLERSVAHGYKDVEHMEKDSDLDSIRDSERYKKLVEKLKQ